MSAAVASRPGSHMAGSLSQRGMLSNLPPVAHPFTKLGRPEDISLEGIEAPATDVNLVRSATEVPFRVSLSRAGSVSKSLDVKLPHIDNTALTGSPVKTADPNKTTIPVIGARSELGSRCSSSGSRSDSSLNSQVLESQARTRQQVDELEKAVKSKVSDNFYSVKTAFQSADVEGKGTVTREQCHRIMMTMTSRTISLKLFNHLMARVGLGDKSIIHYGQFYTAFRNEVDASELPQIFDSQFKELSQDKNLITATQANLMLREKVRQRMLNIGEIIPNFQTSDDPNEKGRIVKLELFCALKRLGINMKDEEFDKLWTKFDTQNLGVIDSKLFIKKLGVKFMDDPKTRSVEPIVDRAPRKRKEFKFERILRQKIADSVSKVRSEFEKCDPHKTGKIEKQDLAKVLSALELPQLSPPNLLEFVVRLGFSPDDREYDYDVLIEKIQKNEQTAPMLKFFNGEKQGDQTTSIQSLMQQFTHICQPDLENLRKELVKADNLKLKSLPYADFKKILKDLLKVDIEQNEEEAFKQFLSVNDLGEVNYEKFLSSIDIRTPFEVGTEDNDAAWAVFDTGRPLSHLSRQIKLMIGDYYDAMEEYFKENIDNNIDTGRFNQHQFLAFINAFDIHPEVSAEEVRRLWRTFHLNQDKTLNYQSFLRHFIYNRRTAAYPNMKKAGPQIGDSDLIRSSNTMNSSRDLVLNMLNRKTDVFWEDVRCELKYLDSKSSGFVTRDQFKEVLTELQVELDPFELNKLCDKFVTDDSGRVNYIEFLKPYTYAGGISGQNMVEIFNEDRNVVTSSVEIADSSKLLDVTARIRSRVKNDIKTIRKAFRKLDGDKTGFLTIPEFKSVLQLCNIVLDEEESFQLMSLYDSNLEGKVKYDKFMNDIKQE